MEKYAVHFERGVSSSETTILSEVRRFVLDVLWVLPATLPARHPCQTLAFEPKALASGVTVLVGASERAAGWLAGCRSVIC